MCYIADVIWNYFFINRKKSLWFCRPFRVPPGPSPLLATARYINGYNENISIYVVYDTLQFLFLFTHIWKFIYKNTCNILFSYFDPNKEVDILFYNIKPLIILTSTLYKQNMYLRIFFIFNRNKHQAYDFTS